MREIEREREIERKWGSMRVGEWDDRGELSLDR